MTKKLLVTGGAGYIGSHLTRRFIEAGYDVTIIDNLYSGFEWALPKEAKFFKGNVGDIGFVKEVLQAQKIEAVVHMAAHVAVGESVENPLKYYLNNTVNSLNLLKAIHEVGIKYFLFSSTAAVYGIPNVEQVNELTLKAPINPYGHSKLMTEQILQDLAFSAPQNNPLNYVILRYFNVAGARPDGTIGQATKDATHLIKVASEAGCGARPHMSIFGTDYPTHDGTCIRDYIHVDDLSLVHVKAMDYLLNGGKSDIFNCGYGKGSTVREVIASVKKFSKVDFKVIEGPRRAGDPPALIANSDKVKKVLGWVPQYNDLDYICKTAYDWEQHLQNVLIQTQS